MNTMFIAVLLLFLPVRMGATGLKCTCIYETVVACGFVGICFADISAHLKGLGCCVCVYAAVCPCFKWALPGPFMHRTWFEPIHRLNPHLGHPESIPIQYAWGEESQQPPLRIIGNRLLRNELSK